MKKWFVLSAVFELKRARVSDVARKVNLTPASVRRMLLDLVKDNLVSRDADGFFVPNQSSERMWCVFNVMKFCRSKGINFNLFLSQSFANIIEIGLKKGEANLADFSVLNYVTVRKYLSFLSRLNLVFVVSKTPLLVKFVDEPVFEEVLAVFGLEKPVKQASSSPVGSYGEIEGLLSEFNKLKRSIDFSDADEEQKIEFTSASTQLEGNTFTLEESRELILHDVIPADKRLKETLEVKNYYSAVNYLLTHLSESLSIQFILDLHRIVVFNLSVREGVRSSNVFIKGNPFYKVTHFTEIFHKLDELCRQVNEFLKQKHSVKEAIEFASFVHNEFQHIHPFEDGNSRVTRLLWNYILLRSGFPLINIYSNAKQEYLSLTKLARERNDAKLNAFLASIVKDNLFKLTRLS